MKTLLLDTMAWDLCLDAAGNIAAADDPYATSQNVASACRTFAAEVYYDTTKGVPYFELILGRYPTAQVIKAALVREALKTPGVTGAQCFLQKGAGRQIAGQVQVTLTSGQTVAAVGGFAPRPPADITMPPGRLDGSDSRQSGWTLL